MFVCGPVYLLEWGKIHNTERNPMWNEQLRQAQDRLVNAVTEIFANAIRQAVGGLPDIEKHVNQPPGDVDYEPPPSTQKIPSVRSNAMTKNFKSTYGGVKKADDPSPLMNATLFQDTDGRWVVFRPDGKEWVSKRRRDVIRKARKHGYYF